MPHCDKTYDHMQLGLFHILISFLIFVLPYSNPCLAHDPVAQNTSAPQQISNPRLVHLDPLLWQAAVEVLGPARARNFFMSWGEEEVKMFQKVAQPVEKFVANEHASIVEERLFKLFGTHLLGAIGEAYAQAITKLFAINTGRIYIDEASFAQNNPFGSKPDGLVIDYMNEDRLVIAHVVEAKMGNNGFRHEQAAGILKVFKTTGIRLPHPETKEIVFYPPSKIYLLYKAGAELPITSTKNDEFQSRYFLFATNPKANFLGSVFEPGFSADRARLLIATYLKKLVFFFHAKNPIKDNVQFMPVALNHSEDIYLPEDLGKALDRWFEKNNYWPRKSKSDLYQHELALEIVRAGGQTIVFLLALSEATQEKLIQSKIGPAIGPFQYLLLSTDPADINALKFFSLFLRNFGYDGDSARSIESRQAIMKALVGRNRGWLDILGSSAWKNDLPQNPCPSTFM